MITYNGKKGSYFYIAIWIILSGIVSLTVFNSNAFVEVKQVQYSGCRTKICRPKYVCVYICLFTFWAADLCPTSWNLQKVGVFAFTTASWRYSWTVPHCPNKHLLYGFSQASAGVCFPERGLSGGHSGAVAYSSPRLAHCDWRTQTQTIWTVVIAVPVCAWEAPLREKRRQFSQFPEDHCSYPKRKKMESWNRT